MNLPDGEPYELTFHYDLIIDDFVMYYNGTAKAQEERAIRKGKATVFYMNAFFYQDCETLIDGNACCKEWRGCWASADFQSPLQTVNAWVTRAQTEGIYLKRKVPASDYPAVMDGFYDGDCYRIVLPGAELDWNALLDVNLDLSFGGQKRLQGISSADVTLLFGAKDLSLKAILLNCETDSTWLSGWIRVAPAAEAVKLDWSEYEIREDGTLQEEWDIALPGGSS